MLVSSLTAAGIAHASRTSREAGNHIWHDHPVHFHHYRTVTEMGVFEDIPHGVHGSNRGIEAAEVLEHFVRRAF